MNRMTLEDYERGAIAEFEHPDGSTGIFASFNITEGGMADFLDIESANPDKVAIVPLRHNTDGRTDFESYEVPGHEKTTLNDARAPGDQEAVGYHLEKGDGPIHFEMTDEQLESLRDFFGRAFRGGL